MTDPNTMIVSTLTVDLLNGTASVGLYKSPAPGTPVGKMGHSSLNISVPISSEGDQSEGELKRRAIKATRSTLKEALDTLDRHSV